MVGPQVQRCHSAVLQCLKRWTGWQRKIGGYSNSDCSRIWYLGSGTLNSSANVWIGTEELTGRVGSRFIQFGAGSPGWIYRGSSSASHSTEFTTFQTGATTALGLSFDECFFLCLLALFFSSAYQLSFAGKIATCPNQKYQQKKQFLLLLSPWG